MPKSPVQISLDCPWVHTDAHRLRMLLLEMPIKCFNGLPGRSLGGPVRVPPPAFII
jgi:hypothetical protein